MKIDLQPKTQSNFQAKISPEFLHSLRGYVNNGENRLKNNYLLSKKIEQYDKFGYDDYTIELKQKFCSYGLEYYLIAVKTINSKRNEVILAIRNSYKGIFKQFMKMSSGDLRRAINKK